VHLDEIERFFAEQLERALRLLKAFCFSSRAHFGGDEKFVVQL
jgi:hypothetical protein